MAKKEKDPFQQLHEDAMLFHNNITKQMNAIFEEQERYMKNLRENLYKDFTQNSVFATKGCAYQFNIHGYDQKDIKIAFKNRMLSVSGEKTDKKSQQAGNFLYSFSIPTNCIGNPDVSFKKEELTITFQEEK